MNTKIGDKKVIKSWAFYDWANSVYSLVISTAVFPLYFEGVTEGQIVRFLGIDWEHPESLYGYVMSFSFLVVAFMSPILSGIADYTGNKKKFLNFFCILGSMSVMSLYFFKDVDTTWLGLIFSILASIGFWSSIVFYNAYLPEIATPEQQDDASAKGFIYGYVGSMILLIICLALIMMPGIFGLTSEGIATRVSFILVGIWWLGFAQVALRRLPGNKLKRKISRDYIWKGYKELKQVYKEIKSYPTLKGFLIAFFLCSVGVQTIIVMAAFFGSNELELKSTDMIITILLIQFVAIFGARFFASLSERVGNFKALKITILIWMVVCICAFSLHKGIPNVSYYFYSLGGLLGFVLGAVQSLTRSTYSKLLPDTEDHTTYFSFYDVTEKIAIVMGTFVYGFLFAITNSMQWSVLSLAIFFLASLLVLNTLKKTKYVS